MADIAFTDVTDSIDPTAGTGTFDVLMQRIESHIERQHLAGRITGSDYATVYLGSLQAAIQQSIQFVLGEQAADKQADLLAAQIVEVSATTVRNDSVSAADVSLKEAQESDIEYVTTNHRPEQTTELQEQIDLLKSQDLNVIENVALVAAQTADIGYVTTNHRPEQLAQLQEQVNKTTAEISLLEQKELTEMAQTSDSLTAKWGTGGTALTGILGAQQSLYNHQSAGFKAKHHVDVVKSMTEVWSVAYAITEGVSPNLPVSLTALGGGAATDLDTEIIEMKAAMDSV